MKFLKLNIFLIWCVLIVGGIRSYVYYQHDRAVARTERGNLELGLKNVSATNDRVAQDVEKIRNDVRQMIFFEKNTNRQNVATLAQNDEKLKSNIEILRDQFKFLEKILADIIWLDRNTKKKGKKKKKKR